MPVTIRDFRRPDRDQLTELVNRHVATVLPGVALSTNVVLSQLEGEPTELIVDPWVAERRCLVAVQADVVVAATLIHRFRPDDDVREGYRGAAALRWFVADPLAVEAAQSLLTAAIEWTERGKANRLFVDQALPAPACLGLSDTWPHLRSRLIEAGFEGPARTELALAIACDELQDGSLAKAAIEGAALTRSVGHLGVRLDLMIGESPAGYIEVGDLSPALARSASGATWTDVGNLVVGDPAELSTVMPALLAAAARWLHLGGIDRLIDYYAPDVHPPEYLTILGEGGFTILTANERGWELPRASG